MKTILIVEDDDSQREVLQLAIQQETPYLAFLASNGEAALKAVEDLKPNLFIIDYLLPGINGLEVYDRLHALAEFEAIPAILLSAAAHIDALAAQKHLQVIAKPFELDMLLSAIREHLD